MKTRLVPRELVKSSTTTCKPTSWRCRVPPPPRYQPPCPAHFSRAGWCPRKIGSGSFGRFPHQSMDSYWKRALGVEMKWWYVLIRKNGFNFFLQRNVTLVSLVMIMKGLNSLQEMECHIDNCKIYAHQFLNVSSIIFCIIHKVPVFSVFLLNSCFFYLHIRKGNTDL